ncbi:uncharacterized protein TNCV_3613141 [Trichonephila clavipes]|uniref:Uncharacterized protein n=1 Tax=Trichonephila clavipes TaxID=2585209 RepID=A0A8X6SM57_TRICX|nr:uncharacterized protein TNCV_3613141 [Trichonephila clavipes]
MNFLLLNRGQVMRTTSLLVTPKRDHINSGPDFAPLKTNWSKFPLDLLTLKLAGYNEFKLSSAEGVPSKGFVDRKSVCLLVQGECPSDLIYYPTLSRDDWPEVAAICDISRSCLDPNDFTVLNCIVKGHVSPSPPSLRLRLCSRFTLLATWTYFDPKDFSPHPSTVSKVMRPFHPLLNKKQRKKENKKET